MELILQIALGVFLGYLLIEHRNRLGRWAVLTIKALLALVVLGLTVYSISTAVDFGKDSGWFAAFFNILADLIGTILIAAPFLAAIGFIGYSFSAVLNWATRGFVKVANDFGPAYLFGSAPVMLMGLLVSASLMGYDLIDRPFTNLKVWFQDRGISAEWATELSSYVILLPPIIAPVLIHTILRFSGAKIAPLCPFHVQSKIAKAEAD